MRAFTWEAASDTASAVARVTMDPDAVFLAGGSNLVDHLKLGIVTPSWVVDVSRLPMDTVVAHQGGLRIGANARNAEVAAHPVVRDRYPVLARALLSGASGQIRNQATTAGNLLQRTRCVYFQDLTTPCNKRRPGSGCSAVGGYSRYNAILGASDACVAVHPSDLAVALSTLDARVVVLGADGERTVPFEQLHRLPGEEPHRDTTLVHGELITAVEVPALPAGTRSSYVKVRDRASYAFAVVSVAAVVTFDGPHLSEVRIGWGGVAHKPWRAHTCEGRLLGTVPTPDTVAAAVDAELADAHTDDGNAFKLPLLRRTTAMVLHQLTDANTAATGSV